MKAGILFGVGVGVAWFGLGVVAGWLLHCRYACAHSYQIRKVVK